jgi:hypothetical protein
MSTQTLSPPATDDEIDLEVTTVTSTRVTPVRVPRALSVDDMARSMATLLSLPGDVPYALRDDGSAEYLDPERSVGEQVAPRARVTVTPKAHLG